MRAAIYTRVSTSMQAEEGFSLEAQQDNLMQTIERKGLQLYRIYSDPGISGKTFKRPGVQAMIADMKAKRFDTLLIHKLDRLSRSMGDIIAFIELVNKLDVRLIISAQGQDEIDTRSPLGKAFLQFNGIWAELYLNNLREETLKGLVKKMNKGGRHMSQAPLGYDLIETSTDVWEMFINEAEAALVREVFGLYLDKRWGVTKIAKHMNSHSTTKLGGKWDNKNVRNMLTNPTYAGFNHFKPDHWPEENRIISPGSHEPIISEEQLDTVRNFRERRSNGHMSKRSFDYPYGGIIKCARCGATFAGNGSVVAGKQYRGYRCLNQYAKGTCDAQSISEQKLNALVWSYIGLMNDAPQEPAKKSKKQTVDIQKEIETSNKRRKNWMMALGDGKLSGEDYAQLIDEEDKRIKALQANVREDSPATMPTAELQAAVAQLKVNWDFIEVETQKMLVQSMLRKVVIDKVDDVWQIKELLTV
ncbi:recombinase family protein [Cohnella sp. GCM10020058]|uniref:recombinase family protein n=1 Tax=Cohnella sp. GCM10020058 TaxID=3317330 RepID=UPI0036258063